MAAGANYAAVKAGYAPYLYCAGSAVVEGSGIAAWYYTLGFGTAVVAVVVGAFKGFSHALKWLVLLVVLCALPGWLEQGFKLGGECPGEVYVPPPLPDKDDAPPVRMREPSGWPIDTHTP
ncbi:hypothetical protein [Methylorubrum sp. SB2]|uniref:hypothetical protein n=1 Tax=Methylorubrum subtropicum TaxID=3138812 RepID=UPI00313A80FE